MRSFRLVARWASSALAILLFAGSLTCVTTACATLCGRSAGEQSARAGAGAPAAEADLPPCHRQSGVPSGAASDAPTGGCEGGGPCCTRWLNNPATLRMADLAPLRRLLPAGATSPGALLAAVESPLASRPPHLGPLIAADSSPPSARPRVASGTRGPPPVAAAA